MGAKEENISKLLLDYLDSVIYAIDRENYELLYMNLTTKNYLGIAANDSSYVGKKCYQILRGKEDPCDFCNNCILKEKEYFEWEHYNDVMKEYFFIKDTLVRYKGRLVRLEVAEKATQRIEDQKKLVNMLEMEKALVQCIQTLSHSNEIHQAVDRLLGIIAEFYQADRAYIFEIQYEKDIICNTYEWCAKGVSAQIDKLKKVPLESVRSWAMEFERSGSFYISNIDDDRRITQSVYENLKEQGVQSLIAAPLLSDGNIIGLIGVDNPGRNISMLELLKSVTYFIIDDFQKRERLLDLQRLSFTDTLTGLSNRNKYNIDLAEMEKNPPSKLGVLYMDVNGLKEANDKYGHVYGDSMLAATAWLLKDVFEDHIYRIGGDEFVVFSMGQDRAAFEEKAAKLRELVQESDVVNASVGSSYQEDAQGVNIMRQISISDNNMYLEKQAYYRRKGLRKN